MMNVSLTDRRWSLTIAAVASMILFASMAFVISMFAGVPQSPIVSLVELDYAYTEVCPGQVVPYGVTWQVDREAMLIVSSSHWRGLNAEGDAAMVGRMSDAALLDMHSRRILTDLDAHFDIPDLPPGDYARVLSVGTLSENVKPAQILQPYTIRDDCE